MGMSELRSRREPDIPLLVIVLALCGFGLALCYSSSAVYAMTQFGDASYFFKRQLVWFFAGLALMMAVQNIDYRRYIGFTRIMILLSVFMLIFVLIPGLGHNAKGAARWISFGAFSVQPSEFIKIFMVIYLVKIFSDNRQRNQVAKLLIPLGIIALVFVLIMMQPDFSTAMDLLFVSIGILFLSGFPMVYIVLLFILSIPMFYLLIYQVDYRRERILAYLDPWKDRFGSGYHIIQSFIAFKKGGFFGSGLGLGEQKIRRLPEPHTDFVFSVIAEELGLAGTIFTVILFSALFVRIIYISLSAPDDFGKLLSAGLGLLIVVQAFLNIGVVTGGLPTTGIPLPFISYGGSSLLSTMLAMGIILNISRYRKASAKEFSSSEVML